tara:strand:- start:236 stop:418 length:183 start_codon:yes stop_codon:yes gene_type:complete
MKQSNMNWIITIIILIMNVLFITTGGLKAALEVSVFFGIFIHTILVGALIGYIYFSIKKK